MLKMQKDLSKDNKDGLKSLHPPSEFEDKGLPHNNSLDRLSSASNFHFGRSIQSGYHISRI